MDDLPDITDQHATNAFPKATNLLASNSSELPTSAEKDGFLSSDGGCNMSETDTGEPASQLAEQISSLKRNLPLATSASAEKDSII